MESTNWVVMFRWVKAHAGILGNEIADTLAKKAGKNSSLREDYKRIPKSVILRELKEESVKKLQNNWTLTTKGRITKEYFPNVEERLKLKIHLTQNLTPITGHGKTRAYLHRFDIIQEPKCPCGAAEQTTDHLIYECKVITTEREKLKNDIQKSS
jgi:hypothetical protein